MQAQFLRIEAFSYQDVPRILGEASREPEYCRHVERPLKPFWSAGSPDAVRDACARFMQTPSPIRQGDGKVRMRKRRRDFRCLVAGVASWPQGFHDFHSREEFTAAQPRMKDWYERTYAWLQRNFADELIAVVLHRDEEHLHLHFFVAGDANVLHPGLRAEFENGRRLSSRAEKQVRYKAAMREMQDSYHADVGRPCGLARMGRGLGQPRIKDRALALRVLSLERKLEAANDPEISAELKALKVSATARDRPRMVFEGPKRVAAALLRAWPRAAMRGSGRG